MREKRFEAYFNPEFTSKEHWSKDKKITVEQAKPYILLVDGTKVFGQVLELKSIPLNNYEIKLGFYLNASYYSPDKKIELNQVKKPY